MYILEMYSGVSTINAHKLTFGAFIQQEMKVRNDMTASEFARMVGVSHATILKFMNHGIEERYAGKPIGDPDIKFLYKLAKATHIDLAAIVAILYPDATGISAEAGIIANRVAQLPPDRLEMFDDFILWLSSQKDSDGAKKNWRIDNERPD